MRKIPNQDIKTKAKEKGVKLWQIGEKLGLSDANFSRLLRHELSQERKNNILQIINELSQEIA